MDDLFNQNGGGCGMTLWKQSDGLRPPGYLFYNRLAQKAGDAFTLMKINGQLCASAVLLQQDKNFMDSEHLKLSSVKTNLSSYK
ncbi:hypothetical protein H6F89_30730 [Cyanobacteria bacterium FACHB-63]|nr:hypothetical protein [Cyanobacteria bacterium FACHB-63]